MRIVNIRKFIKSMGITLGLLLLITVLFIKTSLSHTEISYKKIEIISGDSLWEIAKEEKQNNLYFEDKELRDIMDEIKYINHLSNSSLNIGDQLSIPTI